MSEHSVALWDNLPTISEKDSLVRRVTQVSQVKRTNHVLKPAHKHMQTIEGKRAMLIIDSAITRCLLVSAFPKIIENLDVYGLLLGTETVELFKKYAPLVHEYQALTEAEGVVPLTTQALQVSLDLNSPKPRTSYVSNERIKELKESLFELTRQITRGILKVPAATEALIRHYREWDAEPNRPMRHMTSLLVQLRHLMRHELLTTPQERAQKDDYLVMAERRSLKQVKQVETLMGRLNIMTEEHNKMVEEKNAEISLLMNKLLKLEDETRTHLQNVKEKFLSDDRVAKSRHNANMAILKDDLKATRVTYNTLCEQHRKDKMVLRREKWKIEDEMEGILKRMDAQLYDIQAVLEDRTGKYNKERDAHEELLVKFRPIKEEYDVIMEEKRREEERREHERQEHEAMVAAATFIQSFWRGYKTRRLIKKYARSRRWDKVKVP